MCSVDRDFALSLYVDSVETRASEARAKARINIYYLQMWMTKACGASVQVHKADIALLLET